MEHSFLVIDSKESFRKNYKFFLGIFAEYNIFRIESMLSFKPEVAEEMLGPNLHEQIKVYSKAIELNQPYEGFIEKLERLFQKYFKYIVISLNDTPIGQACILQHSKDTVILHWVYIKPNFRKNHYAYKLINKIADVAKEDGFSSICLETIPTLTDALRLYEKFGFRYSDNYDPSNLSMEMVKKFELIFMKYIIKND